MREQSGCKVLSASSSTLARFWLGCIKSSDLNNDEAALSDAIAGLLKRQILQILIWDSVVSQVDGCASEDDSTWMLASLKLSDFRSILSFGLVPLNERLHFNLLVEFAIASIINSRRLGFKIISIPHESQVALPTLKPSWTVFEHKRLKVNVKLAPNVCHLYFVVLC